VEELGKRKYRTPFLMLITTIKKNLNQNKHGAPH
jgi:hypothetical protein